MSSKGKAELPLSHGKGRPRPPIPKHYECPQGWAYLETGGNRIRIRVLLDSGFNFFLVNAKLVSQFEIPYEMRQKAIDIVASDGAVASLEGKKYSHPITLEIGYGHRSTISAEIAAAGHYDLVIPFGWWYKKHPLSNVEDPEKWEFKHDDCHAHVEDKAVADLYEFDETVAYNSQAQYIGRIGYKKGETEITLDSLPREYLQYKKLYLPETAESIHTGRTFDHPIDLKKGAEAPWGPIYPMSQYQLKALAAYLPDMHKQGKIGHSKSPAGAPILFVPKPDGRLQLCVDYRQLNKLTILNKYPLPLMSELRDRVAGAQIFCKIELKDNYHHIHIQAGEEWKTAFRTRFGHYEYKVMPFGLVNAPATFQAMMNMILREFLDHGVIVYLDDILIYSENYEEHVELVKKVVARLEEHRLAISRKKSVFLYLQ